MNEQLMQLLTSCDYVPELNAIQQEIKAPKNKLGPNVKDSNGKLTERVKYKYRDLEDIYEVLKPLLEKYQCTLMFREFQQVTTTSEGGNFNYKYSVAILINKEGKRAISSSPIIEVLNPRMDPAQVSGSVTTYARKNALQGLLLLDNSPDETNIDAPAYQNNYYGQPYYPQQPIQQIYPQEQQFPRGNYQQQPIQQPQQQPQSPLPRKLEDNPRYQQAMNLLASAPTVVELTNIQRAFKDVWSPALQQVFDDRYIAIKDFGIN